MEKTVGSLPNEPVILFHGRMLVKKCADIANKKAGMSLGESGVGKSTLINSMFLTDIYHPTDHPGPSLRLKKTVQVCDRLGSANKFYLLGLFIAVSNVV